MLPFRRRVIPLACVFLGAPITAEYLYAYLPFTGDLWMSLIAILFFAPLYGGAALLIREIAVRTGRGWLGVLLLATAFGFAMPGVIDLSLFGAERADVAFWSELREPTLISALGVSAFPTLTWTLGHVMMSIAAPLALLHALAPAHRGRPLLGKLGIPLMLAAATVAGIAVFQDGRQTYGYVPSLVQIVSVLAIVAVIAGVAFTRAGAPLKASPATRAVPSGAVVGGAVLVKVSIDVLPPTWFGVLILVMILALSAVILYWLAGHRRWEARDIGLLGAGVVVGGTLAGFLSPVPAGVTFSAKIAHSSVLLVLTLAVLALVLLRTSEGSGVPGASRPRLAGRAAQDQEREGVPPGEKDETGKCP